VSRRGTFVEGARAGGIAALAWAAAEPALGRVFGTRYSDVRLLGRFATRGSAWPVAGIALHAVNGALFGSAFRVLGLRGVKHGIVAAEAENLVLWPALLVADRVHPDRRDGTLPPLASNSRVAAYEVAAHALFGAVLGALTRAR
jgi:hypothetical protein